MRHGVTAVVFSGLAMALAATAFGQSSEPTPMQTRQSQFREIGTAFKAINDELRKDTPGRFAMGSSARLIAGNLHRVGTLFPPGSGPGAGIKTKAKPNIWTDRAQFDRLNASAASEADRLVAIMKGNDLGAIRAQVPVLGAACKSCHQQFRAEDS